MNWDDRNLARELAAAFAFAFWPLARAQEEPASTSQLRTKANMKYQQRILQNQALKGGEGGRGIANPAPFTLLEGTRATKRHSRGEKKKIAEGAEEPGEM